MATSDGIEDWSNVATEGNDQLDFRGAGSDPREGEFTDPPFGDDCVTAADPDMGSLPLYGTFDRAFVSHHCFVTAVHAVHIPDNKLFLMHGENDQRVWEIGAEPSTMTWHPIPIRTDFEVVEQSVWVPKCDLPDIFCTGHMQLADGRLFFAGGNVTGNPSGGGLNDTYLFDPIAAQAAAAPGIDPNSTFGWEFEVSPLNSAWRDNAAPRATYDRWYPTLTMLPDGRVLIAGGDSRVGTINAAVPTRVLEVYDPLAASNGIVPLPGGETGEAAWFPDPDGVPQYPFMFVLPNGHVLYAGAESASNNGLNHYGQVLVPSPRGSTEPWSWLELDLGGGSHGIRSFIRGGSAVMFAPGKVMKTGGS